MTATNHSANQGRVPAQGVPAQQMPVSYTHLTLPTILLV